MHANLLRLININHFYPEVYFAVIKTLKKFSHLPFPASTRRLLACAEHARRKPNLT